MSPQAAARPHEGGMVDENDRIQRQRHDRVTARFDLVLSVLAFIMLALLVAELTGELQPPWSEWVMWAQIAIWAVFLGAFLVELRTAPAKWRFLRENWLVVLSLALPFLRILRIARALRILRAARVTRGLALGRTVGALTRARRASAMFVIRSHLAYILALTVILTITAAAAVRYFEGEVEGASIRTVPDALWWAATLVTTVNTGQEALTLEGRLISLLLRVYGLTVSGYLTAQVAVFLLRARSGTGAANLDAIREDARRLADALDRLDDDSRRR